MVDRWRSPLGELGPAPAGQLELEVECRRRRRAEPTAARGVASESPLEVGRHRVVLGPDWQVRTPHDVAAERREVGLGGESSCLTLVDSTVPAARDLVQLRARRVLPPLARTAASRWVVTSPSHGCRCGAESYATPQEAAHHVRTAGHHAPRYGAPVADLEQLLATIEDAHGGFSACPPPGWVALSCVQQPRDLDTLWEAGVPPELIIEVQDMVLPRGAPLSLRAQLGAAFHCPDLPWLAELAAREPTVQSVEWAAWAWTEEDRRRPAARGAWLDLGLAPREVDLLMASGMVVGDAEPLAEATDRSVAAAAQVLARWVGVGCRPGPGDIAMLDSLGVAEDDEPSAAEIDAAVRRLDGGEPRLTRTQVAVSLARERRPREPKYPDTDGTRTPRIEE